MIDRVLLIAAVLAQHTFRTSGSQDAYLGNCNRPGCPTKMVSATEHATHQAERVVAMLEDIE